MAIKLIAFDWNGTLIADAQLASDCDNHALRPYIKHLVSLNDMRRHFSVPVVNYLTALGMDKNFAIKHHKEINNAFNKYYEARVGRCRTRAGTKDALKFLEDIGIKTMIYSNHVTSYITRQLKRLDIEKYFDAVLARGDTDQSHMHSRGKEQRLIDYVKKLKLKPREVISVGDTDEEIQIGKHYGFYTVGITGGYSTPARLKKHHPDFLIHNMVELKKIVQKLNK